MEVLLRLADVLRSMGKAGPQAERLLASLEAHEQRMVQEGEP